MNDSVTRQTLLAEASPATVNAVSEQNEESLLGFPACQHPPLSVCRRSTSRARRCACQLACQQLLTQQQRSRPGRLNRHQGLQHQHRQRGILEAPGQPRQPLLRQRVFEKLRQAAATSSR
jgi:hypothetical protein